MTVQGEVTPPQPAGLARPQSRACQQQDRRVEVLGPGLGQDPGQLVVGETVHRWRLHADPAAVLGDVAQQPVLAHRGVQRRAQCLPEAVHRRRRQALLELGVGEVVEVGHLQVADQLVAQPGDDVVVDVGAIATHGGRRQGSAARLALGRLLLDPPPQVVAQLLVGHPGRQLFLPLAGVQQPVLGVRPGVERAGATVTTTAGADPEIDLRHEAIAALDDRARTSPGPALACPGHRSRTCRCLTGSYVRSPKFGSR